MKLLPLLLLLLASPLAAQDSVKVETRTRQVPVVDSIITKYYSTKPVPPVDTVKPPATGLLAITVDPTAATVAVGGKTTFTAKGWGKDGLMPIPSLRWTATGGTITSAGVFTGGQVAGTYAVTATGTGATGLITNAATVVVTGTVIPPGVSTCLPTDLLCEDFEDGWYTKNCDVANASGGLASQDGWCGTIYNAAGLASGTSKCGNLGVKSNCVATTGVMSGGTTGNMGDKALARPVSEIRVVFYTKPLSGYQFGAEKMLTFNDGVPGGAGIRFGNLSWNCASSSGPNGKLTMGVPVPDDRCLQINVGDDKWRVTPGPWYRYEVHYKLSDPGQKNGVFELWVDACGTTGLSCPSTPTQRMRYTDVNNNRTSTSQNIKVLWFEAWSNPVSRGERYWDQIVAREGNTPIGAVR